MPVERRSEGTGRAAKRLRRSVVLPVALVLVASLGAAFALLAPDGGQVPATDVGLVAPLTDWVSDEGLEAEARSADFSAPSAAFTSSLLRLGTLLGAAGSAFALVAPVWALLLFGLFCACYHWRGRVWRRCHGALKLAGVGAAQVPPYFWLMVFSSWLGFASWLDGCAKQSLWMLAAFLVLLPHQVLKFGLWMEEADAARFLVARRALGVPAAATFWHLFRTRWQGEIAMMAAYGLATVLLVDMTVWWVAGRSFTCSGRHWLEALDNSASTMAAWESVLLWVLFAGAMYLTMAVPAALQDRAGRRQCA